MTTKYGYWEVNNKLYTKKYNALVAASQTKSQVLFYYHNDIWDKFDRSQLGKIHLDQLYKERAQQLRDKYQYLILNYSGGADSHNILRTFIDNNIHLDEICVKWPKPLMDGKFYTVNNIDTEAINRWSEWNYSIKPTLEWLKANRPKIKITIEDFIGKADTVDFTNLFDNVNHIRNAGMLATICISNNDKEYSGKGISTCQIYGTDKPLLNLNVKTNCIGMFFTDMALDMVWPGEDKENAECFYWSPDFPILAFEMAYQMSIRFELNPELRKFLFRTDPSSPNKRSYEPGITQSMCQKVQHDIAIESCYKTWDYRFQTGKMRYPDASDKYAWFFTCNEFDNVRKLFYNQLRERLSNIDERFVPAKTTYLIVATKGFYFKQLS